MANTDQDRITLVLTALLPRRRYDAGDVGNYLKLDHAHRQELMRNLFQRAHETADAEPHTEETYRVRRSALIFAAQLVDAIESKDLHGGRQLGSEGIQGPASDDTLLPLPAEQEAGARWFFTTLARRFFENDFLEQGLPFGDRSELLECAKESPALAKLLTAPAAAIREQLTMLSAFGNLSLATTSDVAYEGAYFKQIKGDYVGAMEIYGSWAAKMDGEEGLESQLTATIMRLQRAKAAIDGISKGAKVPMTLEEVLTVQQGAINHLETRHESGNKIAKQWLENTLPSHLDMVGKLDANLVERAEKIKLAAARARMDITS